MIAVPVVVTVLSTVTLVPTGAVMLASTLVLRAILTTPWAVVPAVLIVV